MLTSCLNGFKAAAITIDQLVVKQMAKVKHPLSLGEATHGCRTVEDDDIRMVHPPILWTSAVIRINKDIMMAMPAARGHFPRKSFLSLARQAPLQQTCVWLTLICTDMASAIRAWHKFFAWWFASSVINSDTVFDKKRAIKLQLWGTDCCVSD